MITLINADKFIYKIGEEKLDMVKFIDTNNISKIIETQEKMGQLDVVKNIRLPKKANCNAVPEEIYFKDVLDSMSYKEREPIVTRNNINYTREQYEKMGIKIVNEYDDLFWNVVLPEGWEIKATSHNMWNDLFDNKGRKRISFFYKAAFYDRDAFINFNTRFTFRVDHIAEYTEDYDVWKMSDYQGVVKDGDKVIYSTDCVPATGDYNKDDKIKEKLKKELENFLKENYPDYKNIHAYWD
jgi:hypothetical protein